MNTRNSLTPAYPELFRGPFYENRRPLPRSREKPRIHKLYGVDTWVCRLPGPRPQMPGFGITPIEAYNDWKSWVTRC
jgi:hypothetical protein